MRGTPSAGYDNGRKRQYRRTVWRGLRRWGFTPRSGPVLVLCGEGGHEIDWLVGMGVPRNKIWAGDRHAKNLKAVALAHPGIKRLHGDVGAWCQFLGAHEGHPVFRAVNLDFSGMVDVNATSIAGVMGSECVQAGTAVAITVQGSRESRPGSMDAINLAKDVLAASALAQAHVKPRHIVALTLVNATLARRGLQLAATPSGMFSYRSVRAHMEVLTGLVVPMAEMEECLRAIDRHGAPMVRRALRACLVSTGHITHRPEGEAYD